MKTLYEAANAIEAHMILNLLERQGWVGRIDGEYLQGGVGELPAIGLVRVMVDEQDYPAAKAFMDKWDATQPMPTPLPKPPSRANMFNVFVAGLVVGLLCAYAYYRAPTNERGIDYDGDGVLDEKWTYAPSGVLLKSEMDRNHDGKFDFVVSYDYRGWIKSAKADDNFDGYFETKYHYDLGEVETQEVDTDIDGVTDMRAHYAHGVLTTTEYFATKTRRVIKIEYFKSGKLTHADLNTNRDGKMDRRTHYDEVGEVISVIDVKE
jgi:antitoxin component YwqK of YwqJK toxin-antitoxin module